MVTYLRASIQLNVLIRSGSAPTQFATNHLQCMLEKVTFSQISGSELRHCNSLVTIVRLLFHDDLPKTID